MTQTKIPASKIQEVITEVDAYLRKYNITRSTIIVGVDAWTLAHRVKFTDWAYAQPGLNDAHIQTALQRIFPNVVFKDKKRY